MPAAMALSASVRALTASAVTSSRQRNVARWRIMGFLPSRSNVQYRFTPNHAGWANSPQRVHLYCTLMLRRSKGPDMTSPRIAVLGAGANGASIGADLTAAGHDVVLIEQWPEHVERMRSHGLRILSPEGELTVHPRTMHLCEVATLRKKFDIVLMLMKAYDSRWAAQLIAPHLADDGLLAGLQNGMTVDAIASAVGISRTMGTVIEVSSTMDEPGLVHRHTGVAQSWFAVGAPDGGPSGREEDVASLLRHSGTVQLADNIIATKWMKLISN